MAEEKHNWLGPYMGDRSIFGQIVQQAKLVYNLMLDPRVHPVTKLIPVAAVAYLLLPVDIVPDVVPVLGQMDDLALLMLGFRFFLEFAPPDVVLEHLKRLSQVVRSNWDVVDNPPPPSPAEPPPAPEADTVDGTYHVEE